MAYPSLNVSLSDVFTAYAAEWCRIYMPWSHQGPVMELAPRYVFQPVLVPFMDLRRHVQEEPLLLTKRLDRRLKAAYRALQRTMRVEWGHSSARVYPPHQFLEIAGHPGKLASIVTASEVKPR